MAATPERIAGLVREAVSRAQAPRPGDGLLAMDSVPVRPPRRRPLARMLFEGDALKADVRRFFSLRRGDVDATWTVDEVLAVEESLRDCDVPVGSFLGILRFSCDLVANQRSGQTSSERRLWGLLGRRLASSSGLLMVRSTSDGLDVLRSLLEEVDPDGRRGFADLLRVLGARTGVSYLHNTRLAERSLWDFAVLLASRSRAWNRLHGSDLRRLQPLDFYWGAISVYVRDRQLEPGLPELRSAVLQTGAPLAHQLDAWLRRLAGMPGSSLLEAGEAEDRDPRDWVWDAGQRIATEDSVLARQALMATSERALLDVARRQEAWKEGLAHWLEGAIREEIDRELPLNRRIPGGRTPEPVEEPLPLESAPRPAIAAPPPVPGSRSTIPPPALPVRPPPRPVPGAAQGLASAFVVSTPAPVPAPPARSSEAPYDPIQAALAQYERSQGGGYRQTPPPEVPADPPPVFTSFSETSDALPTFGFGIEELQRQAALLQSGLDWGATPVGRPWIDRFHSLLGDARVREFLRLPPSWIAGLREALASGEALRLAGLEDLVRFLYPRLSRPDDLDFRQHQRIGDGTGRRTTGYDWTVLRALCLALAESALPVQAGTMPVVPLIVVRRWQAWSRAQNLPSHTPAWWAWLQDDVERRCDEAASMVHPGYAAFDPALARQVAEAWIALPRPSGIDALGEWARSPVAALASEPLPATERWASRLSMLTQLLEEAKEDALSEVLIRPV